jgi:predicted  nucleic acid-binding Zn-ribbon protein
MEAGNQFFGQALEAVEPKLQTAEGRAAAAQRRASEAEAKVQSTSAARNAARGSHAQVEIELQRFRHETANDRVSLSQADRGRQAVGRELGAARQQAAALVQENADLQAALAAAHAQIRQLESIQAFSDSWDEQRQGRSRAAAAEWQQHERAASLSLSDLCDLEGLASQLREADGSSSPQCSDGAERPGSSLPSGLWAVRDRRQRQERQAGAEAACVGGEEGPPAGYEDQVLDQEGQLEEEGQRQSVDQAGGDHGPAWRQLILQLQGEVGKLKQRNMRLQAALAEASLRSARDAAAAQEEAAALRGEAAALLQQRDSARDQLAQLQAVAAAAADEGEVGKGGAAPRLEQLHEELVEYAARCNAAVERSAGARLLPLLPSVPGWRARPRLPR